MDYSPWGRKRVGHDLNTYALNNVVGVGVSNIYLSKTAKNNTRNNKTVPGYYFSL